MEKVDENIGKGFEIVTAWVFNTTVVVEWGICSGTGKDLVILSKWYVDMGSRVFVPLGKAKIDNVDIIATTIGTD